MTGERQKANYNRRSSGSRYLATSPNALKRPEREVLVLQHIRGLTLEDLAGLLDQPVDQVRARTARAERRLAQWLGAADVGCRLAEFAAGLDGDWTQKVAACALEYLTTCGRCTDRGKSADQWELSVVSSRLSVRQGPRAADHSLGRPPPSVLAAGAAGGPTKTVDLAKCSDYNNSP